MSSFRKRLQDSVRLLAVCGTVLQLPLSSRAADVFAPRQPPIGFRTGEGMMLASAAPPRRDSPNGFRADRVALRPPPVGFRASAPQARDPAMTVAAAERGRKSSGPLGNRSQNRQRPPGFRTSAPGLDEDAIRETQDARALSLELQPPNGTAPSPDGTLPRLDLPGDPMIPGEGLLLVPEMPPASSRRLRLRDPSLPPEIEVEMEEPVEEEKLPEPEPLHTTTPWPSVSTPVFGSEEVTEFSQQIVSAGRWSLRPIIGLGVVYDGNVFINDADTQKDIIVRVAPGVLFRLGNDQTPLLLQAGYVLNAGFYLGHSSEDAFDQTGRIDLSWRLAKLSLGLRLGVDSATTTSLDASGRIDRTSYYAGVTARYDLSEKLSFDLGSNYRNTRVKGLIGATEMRVQGYLDYRFSPKLSLGAGGAVGVDQVQDGGDQNFQQASLRATFATTAKLTLAANVGVEFRQFENDGASATNPVFGVDAAWAAREGTNVTLSALRRIYNSAVLNEQNYTATAILVSVQQRMTDRFDLFFTAGFENLVYSSAGSGVTADRVDNAVLLRAGIQWHALAWLNAGLFYEFSQDVSSGSGDRSFARDRIGTQINLLF